MDPTAGERSRSAARRRGRRTVDEQLTRFVDVVVSSIALALSSPALVVIVLAIRLDSRGPAIFRQARVGRDREVFTIYKFRTMYHGVSDSAHRDQNLRELAGEGRLSGEVAYKDRSDPRVTRVGRVLRRFSLDELPQLVNVVAGDMALVGPRPSLTWEVDEFPEWAAPRFDVRPGITGVWQVGGRNQVSMLEMLELDVAYARTRSLPTDLGLLARTIPAVLGTAGAA